MLRRGHVGADHACRAIRAGTPENRTAARRHRRDRPAGAWSTPRALGDARRTAPNPEDDLASNGGSSTPGVGTFRCPSGLGLIWIEETEPCDGIPSAAVEAC